MRSKFKRKKLIIYAEKTALAALNLTTHIHPQPQPPLDFIASNTAS